MIVPEAAFADEWDDSLPPWEAMAYVKPITSFNQVNKAAIRAFMPGAFDRRVSASDFTNDVETIWNWRVAHSYPLNALHMTLRNRTRHVDGSALTAQRLKRFESILRKLRRKEMKTMHLSQMQDIGGCRAVVKNMSRLRALHSVYEERPLRHSLSKTRDYIAIPKDDGYRSIHLMYRFSGRATSLPWDKLRIEIQLKTKLQHAWATAVETVDLFTGQDLKFGEGLPEWRRFFALMGSVHAIYEDSPTVAETPDTHSGQLAEVRDLEQSLEVIHSLNSYRIITQHIAGWRGGSRDWFLIKMKPEERSIQVWRYSRMNFRSAQEDLARAEEEFNGTRNQAVLVSAASVSELKRAYPNYFADTQHFVTTLKRFLEMTVA